MPASPESLQVHVISLGCPKNRVDTEHVLGRLPVPLTFVETAREADLVFINTCGFIEPAVRESVDRVLEVIADLADAPHKPLLAVAGCLVGRYGASTLASELPEVDLWLPTSELASWPETLARTLTLAAPHSHGRQLSTGPSYAWLKIGEGCRHHCAFCTIPSIRGDLRSVAQDTLMAEARTLLAQGVRELDLVAQDVTAYGAEHATDHTPLKKLIAGLAELDQLFWLRLLYLYPTGLTHDLLHFLKEVGRPVLPYFDLPLQHASSAVLKRMGRPFHTDPREVLDRVRSVFPEAALRTTFIVGFPGETEADAEALYRLVEEAHFHHVGVFTYQREEGTAAFSAPNQVPAKVAEERKQILMNLQKTVSHQRLSSLMGTRSEVLVDSPNPDWPGLYNGRVWFQAPEVDGQTYVSGPGVGAGRVVHAELVSHTDYDLSALTDQEACDQP